MRTARVLILFSPAAAATPRSHERSGAVSANVEIARALIITAPATAERPCSGLATGPRQLLPVANKPILFHNLEALRRAGVLEAVIAVDDDASPEIRSAVGDGAQWGLTVDYMRCPGGTALGGALEATRDFVADEPVLVQSSDTLMLERMHTHIAAFAGERLDALALRLAGGGAAASAGYLLSHRAVSLLREAPANGLDPLIRVRRNGGHVRVQDVEGCRPCHGGAESLLESNRRVLESLRGSAGELRMVSSRIQGPVEVHPTARLERTLVRGPAVIGAGVRLTDAYVGPYTSIANGVTIQGTEIEYSIVLEDAELSFVGTRIESSVIGRGARITRAFELPSALRLTVGDGAQVSVA
jgi:glucose-1-phosphate thymidylyltransferase